MTEKECITFVLQALKGMESVSVEELAFLLQKEPEETKRWLVANAPGRWQTTDGLKMSQWKAVAETSPPH